MQPCERPFVTVIVPCRDERSWVGACLESILASDYPPARMEVVVADGMSRDGTRGIIESYATQDQRVRLIDNPERITPVALNRAVEAARGEIIVRVDAHAEVAPEYLRRAVDYLEATGADNVGGAMRTVPRDRGPFAEPICIVLTHPLGVGNSRFRTGSDRPRWVDTVFGGCWRRQVFDRVGKFNEKLVRSQDMEFNVRLRRAGGKILLAPDLEARYYARATLAAFWRHNWINGVWAVLPFAYSDVVPVRWRHLAPLAFVFALAASVLGWSAGWFPGEAPAAVAGPYGATILAASAAVALRERKVTLALVLPATFASLHLGYGAGSLWGAVRLAGIQSRKFIGWLRAKGERR
ncbi:MAG TPA: glycosyltransferase family 2 protein [Bryobacteraceae bacterium]|nr:glycosyltransferase family 2 protein [Bryobacteraceae bacterium]